MITSSAPSAAARRAIAAPRPWVEPVTTILAAVEPLVGERVITASPAAPSRSDSHAASPIASGARASTAPTGGVVPLATAPMNASHSRR